MFQIKKGLRQLHIENKFTAAVKILNIKLNTNLKEKRISRQAAHLYQEHDILLNPFDTNFPYRNLYFYSNP